MVNYPNAPSLDSIFSALADPTRRAILARLARGVASVGELAEPFDMSLPAVSKHLRVLEGAGLLERRVEGRVHRLELAAEPLRAALQWIETYRRFWSDRLDALAEFVEHMNPQEDTWPHRRSPPTPRSGSSARSRPRAKRSSRPGRRPQR